jgi:hypothetical protein
MARFNGTESIKVDDLEGRYTWKHPVAEELPKIVEDLDPGNNQKGRDGHPFQIAMSKPAFGITETITYDKFQGKELYIIDRMMSPNNYTVYTVTLIGSTDDPDLVFDNAFLAQGTEWFRVTSHKTSYGQEYADMRTQARYKEFYNFVGNTYANVEYSISNEAELIKRGGMTTDGKIPVKRLWEFDASLMQNMDPSVNSITQVRTMYGDAWLKKQMDNGNLVRSYITKLEAAHFQKIAIDIENNLMWSKGGRIPVDANATSPEDARTSMGLWKQTQNAYTHVYNLHEFTLDMFKSELFNFYNGRVDFQGMDSKRDLLVQTGTGGLQLVSTGIENRVNGKFDLDAERLGVVSGDAMSLSYGYAFTKYKIPFLANVEFVLNPALSPAQANDLENPMVAGHRLSSYSFLIFDVTETGAQNIKLLERKWGSELQWSYINGTMDFMGRPVGFQSSSRKNGYDVIIQQAHKAIWIEDPTKILRFVMRNPLTGGTL